MELIVILLAIALGFSGALTEKTETPEPVDTKQNEVVETSKTIKNLDSYSIMTVDAEEWLRYYSDNALDAKQQLKIKENWKHKFIKLTGNIYNVRNNMDGCYITIRQERKKGLSDGWCMIVCYFYNEADKEKVLKMHSGDRITVYGFSRWDIGPILINSHVR
jgi:hypothetical protein